MQYWLIDTRPKTIAAGYPIGRPVYTGTSQFKTESEVLSQLQKAKKEGARWESIKVLESLQPDFRIDILKGEAITRNTMLRAVFPPETWMRNKRLKRYDDQVTPQIIETIRNYLPGFSL